MRRNNHVFFVHTPGMRRVRQAAIAVGLAGAVAAGGAVRGAQQSAAAQGGPVQSSTSASTPGTGLLMGQVVDGTTGRPIADAVVSMNGGARGAAPAGGRGAAAAPSRVLVDGQGRFLFRDLAAGSFSLTAAKAGYFGGASGQTSPRGQGRPIELLDGERRGDVTLRLWPFAVISGAVFDETGAPVTGATVQLFKRLAIGGAWRYTSAGPGVTSDDTGAYRIGSVMPGDYLVGVRSDAVDGERLMISLAMTDEAIAMKVLAKFVERGDDNVQIDPSVRLYPPTLYPAALQTRDAMTVSVEPGAERGNVDFSIKAVPAHTVAGAVTSAEFDPSTSNVNLRLRGVGDGAVDLDFNTPSASTDASGHFVFRGVPAGQYQLEATSRRQNSPFSAPDGRGMAAGAPPLSPASDTPVFSASMPITVGARDLSDIAVPLTAGGRVTGRTDFVGTNPPSPELLTQISVTLEAADPSIASPRGRVESDGTFKTGSVPPGRYFLRVGTLIVRPPGSDASAPGAGTAAVAAGPPTIWRPLSATINGHDALDEPLEIVGTDVTSVLLTFSDKPAGTVTGLVRDAKGDGDPQAAVILFPTDDRLWNDFAAVSRRIKLVRTSRYGQYSVTGLAAGEYYIAAANSDHFIDWDAPGALETYLGIATRIVIADGQSKTLDLKSGAR